MFIVSLTRFSTSENQMRRADMVEWFTWCGVVALIGTLLIVLPVSGALFTIPEGGTAFIGEKGLDITQTGATSNSMIGWFGTQDNGTSGEPSAKTSVDDAKNFYIAPAIFSNKTGAWYTLPEKKLAFYVEDPALSIRVFDETSNFDVTGTGRTVPKGDQLSFTIETNLVEIANRPGITSVPITIDLMQPNGNELAQVSGFQLNNIGVIKSPYSTGAVWDTSNYPIGPSSVWAYSNVNGIKDNYPVVGKTETDKARKIQILVATTSPATQAQTGVTGTTPPGPVSTTIITITATSAEQTTVPLTSALSTVPTSLPTATTKAPGPDMVLIAAGLGIAALIAREKDAH